LRSIISAGVDAAIVQDVGICRLIRKLSPDFPIHASTQMTVTSQAGVEFVRELGCNLVVLARECSIKEVGKIHAAEQAARESGAAALQLPLEVFVHGALCVAYSGQCLTSESLGGRSANRGECAQACRMPYELVCDGKDVPLGDKRYLLSPQDLAGLSVLPDLIQAGVASLKIEGRLKTPEYVANITRVYRNAVDKVFAELGAGGLGMAERTRQLGADSSYDLEMGFSRGLYSGWFKGINNQQLVHARFGKKRGVYLGEVKRIRGEQVVLELEAPLKKGDGVVFDAGRPDQKEEGGRIYSIHEHGREATLGFGHGDIDFHRVHAGDKLWKTSDPELERRLRQTFTADRPLFRRPIRVEAHGHPGAPLTLIVHDELGNVVRASSTNGLQTAEKHPLTTERLREQLGRLGGTCFELGSIENHLQGEPILPMSELNQLRRKFVDELDALRRRPKRWQLAAVTQISPVTGTTLASDAASDLIVLVRNMQQLGAALQAGVSTVYCEFEDPKKYREAVLAWREGCAGSKPGERTIWVAPPRISKPGEEWILKQVLSSEADGYLVRNYDQLKYFSGHRRTGDFSLNIANGLSAEYFKNRFGLERITASYDLNFHQLEALIRSVPPHWLEVTIHQHMPMFHMEHCVFCAFLSKGTDFTNCGRPCDTHEVKLRDRAGAQHFLKADAGCRNTVFNAMAQTGAEYVARMLALGVRSFRIEFMNEGPEQVTKTIAKYRELLLGRISGPQLWSELKLLNQLGVTRGQMEKAERFA
ncbi:MAG TPA: DUF3656 domain-containing protein, partial [Candidatus Saccharimonadales bacterium]|nr:DUF3656 domain-containing protein [Candidatus Saccharimonadales bacterium]